MGKNNDEKAKDIISPGGTVIFSENELDKILKENLESGLEKLSHFPCMVDTIQNPWEVWCSKEKGVVCFKFIKLYKDGIGCVVKTIIKEDNRNVVDDFMIFTEEQAGELDAQRYGFLFYVNNDLIEIKKDI